MREVKEWSIEKWNSVERLTRTRALNAKSEKDSWQIITKEARGVMRNYTTSFFIVSRFLPAIKRAKVEIIYSAVRYPDEIVDTFHIDTKSKNSLLNEWRKNYEVSLSCDSIRDSMQSGVPPFLAAFAEIVKESGIPKDHYHAFLDAMQRDVEPQPFSTLEDLIDNYIYGSAIVVGYFLAYVYGAKKEEDFERALRSASDLGIALQLTNFLRDVGEDERRGRVYLPQDLLREFGIEKLNVKDGNQHFALAQVLNHLALIADDYYKKSKANLDAFSPDCRLAIDACIKVYSRLNERIAKNKEGIKRRESVPMSEKFKVLPPSKYWRIPLAYLFR